MLKQLLAQQEPAKVIEAPIEEAIEQKVETVKILGSEMDLGIESIEDIAVMAEFEITDVENAENELSTLEASLESIQAYALSAVETGGLRPEANGLVLGIYADLTAEYEALRPEEYAEVSQESLNEDGAQLQMTEYAAESIAATLKKIVETAKRLVEAGIKAALKFYDQHLTLAGRVGKAAQRLLDSTATMDGQPDEATVEFGSIAYMDVDGVKVDTRKLLPYYQATAKETKSQVKTILQFTKDLSGITAENADEVLAKVKEVKEALRSQLTDAFETKDSLDAAARKSFAFGEKYTEVKAGQVLPGNRAICIGYGEEDMVIKAVTMPSPKDKLEKLSALEVSGINTVAQTALDLVSVHADLIKQARLLTESGKGLIAAVVTASKTLSKDEDVSAATLEELKSTVSMVKSYTAMIRTPYVELAKNVALCANAHVQYGDASRKNLVKPEAK